MIESAKMHTPIFSVITPSYNMVEYLPLCCASVADQSFPHEHIVVDGASDDDTPDWLASRHDVISVSKKDEGMYDALNTGIRMSCGEIISCLNCDEQYLTGVLTRVAEIFNQNPQLDVLFGNALIVNTNGELLSYRKSFMPRWPYIWASHLYVHTSSMFVRRRVFEATGMFGENWKAVGDMDFVIRVLRNGFLVQHVAEYYSTFTFTGSNISTAERGLAELRAYRNTAPLWLRRSAFIFQILMRFEKLLNGAYWQNTPIDYSIYTKANLNFRSKFVYNSSSPLYPHDK